MQFTIDDREADYLIQLVATRPIAEALGLYGKLTQQAMASKAPAQALAAPASALNGSGEAEVAASH